MSDLALLTLCFAAGCLLWAGVARSGRPVLMRWRASDALAFLLAVHVTRVAVRLAAGDASPASITLAAAVSGLAFAGIAALRARLPQARPLAWAAGTLGALDLVFAFAEAFVGTAPVVSPVQIALSGIYLPALLVGQVALLATLLRPEAPAGAWHIADSHLVGSAFTSRRESR